MKKIFVVFLMLLMAICSSFAMGCIDIGGLFPGGDKTPGGGETPGEHTHNYISNVISPTCTARGYTKHTCSCGESYSDTYVDALGHLFTNYISDNNATATSGGTKTAVCDRLNCNQTDTIDAPILNSGVKYVLSEDSTYYIAYGYDNESGVTDIIVLGTYNNKPVKKIKIEAFSRCREITSVTIQSAITEIGQSAFADCTSLTSVIFEDESQCTTIGRKAFYNCSALLNITIPENITSIGSEAYDGCTAVTEINYNATECADISSSGQNLFYKVGDNGKGIIFTIGANVKKIPARLFSSARSGEANFKYNITDIVFAEGSVCEKIGDSAFTNCSLVTKITIPSGMTYIGVNAFSGCYKLIEVVNESNLDILLGRNSFGSVAGYAKKIIKEEIYTGFRVKDDYTFYLVDDKYYLVNYTGEQTEITLPNSVNGFDYEIYYAFYGNDEITKATISNGITKIDRSSFSGCTSLKSVSFAGGSVCEEIGLSAFEKCTALENITIPNSVKSIGNSVFSGCSSLKDITIPNSVESIGNSAFRGCSSLKDITIPNSVEEIKMSTFEGCSNLESVSLPNNLKIINGSAFYECWKLENISIPNSVESIGGYAFYNCTSLKNIVIPNGVEVIAAFTFQNCEALESVSLPSSIKNIGARAFYDCKALASIDIPSNVEEIEVYAFRGCSSITSVTIPASVTIIGGHAFEYCNSLREVIFEDTVGWHLTTAIIGRSMDVTDSAVNATNIRITYSNYTFEKIVD